LDLGFEMAGFRTLTCVDNDPESCKTLRHNRPQWEVFEGDIRDFRPKGKYDIVIGGPPCQGFSTAGKGNPDDPRNFLWREYFRVVAKVRPRAILLENVAGMLLKKNVHHLDRFLEKLGGLGYCPKAELLDAADFGVPQHRKRLIVVAGRGWTPALPDPATPIPLTVAQAISDLVDRVDVPNHQPNRHAPKVVRRWSRLKEGQSDPSYGRARLRSDRPSTTIRAGGGYGPRGDHLAGFHPPIHYALPRQLTVRESARVQSFPDSWVFCGSKTAQGRQVGNAVPPILAGAVAAKLRSCLEENSDTRRSVSAKKKTKRYLRSCASA